VLASVYLEAEKTSFLLFVAADVIVKETLSGRGPSRPPPLPSSAFRLHWNIVGVVGNESAIMAISHISCALGGLLLALFCVGVGVDVDLLMSCCFPRSERRGLV